jgi:hypothetical protein
VSTRTLNGLQSPFILPHPLFYWQKVWRLHHQGRIAKVFQLFRSVSYRHDCWHNRVCLAWCRRLMSCLSYGDTVDFAKVGCLIDRSEVEAEASLRVCRKKVDRVGTRGNQPERESGARLSSRPVACCGQAERKAQRRSWAFATWRWQLAVKGCIGGCNVEKQSQIGRSRYLFVCLRQKLVRDCGWEICGDGWSSTLSNVISQHVFA